MICVRHGRYTRAEIAAVPITRNVCVPQSKRSKRTGTVLLAKSSHCVGFGPRLSERWIFTIHMSLRIWLPIHGRTTAEMISRYSTVYLDQVNSYIAVTSTAQHIAYAPVHLWFNGPGRNDRSSQYRIACVRWVSSQHRRARFNGIVVATAGIRARDSVVVRKTQIVRGSRSPLLG